MSRRSLRSAQRAEASLATDATTPTLNESPTAPSAPAKRKRARRALPTAIEEASTSLIETAPDLLPCVQLPTTAPLPDPTQLSAKATGVASGPSISAGQPTHYAPHPDAMPPPLILLEAGFQQPSGSCSLHTADPIEAAKAKKPRQSAGQKDAAGPSEYRPARIRQKAPQAMVQRKDRVMSQRMFMMDRTRVQDAPVPVETFAVLGSTGNVYTVRIDVNPTCNCPDCLKGNVPCKHIIFVFLKVLKLPATSTIWYQKGLTLTELQSVFDQAPVSPNDPHHVSSTVRAAFLKATGRGNEVEEVVEEVPAVEHGSSKRDVVGEDCPVCYEEMTEDDVSRSQLVYDVSAGGCGNALHAQCFQMWASTARAKGDEVTCVYCRTPWADADGAKGKGKANPGGAQYSSLGYLNMADVMGMSRERDTSSYYHGPMAGVRMWQKRYSND